MEEQLITFETAKLAKEKEFGFNFGGTHYVKGFYSEEDSNEFEEFEMQQEDASRCDYYIRPTQTILQRWLREVHSINVIVDTCMSFPKEVSHWSFKINGLNELALSSNPRFISVSFEKLEHTLHLKLPYNNIYKTYEEALEKGLFEALHLVYEKNELIAFDTANLAKEKGFGIDTMYYYGFDGQKCSSGEILNWNKSQESIYSAPSQTVLQKWLREEHKIFTYLIPIYLDKIMFEFKILGQDNLYINTYSSYEEALEVALQEGLKLIKL